jgi:drug/metabolite transporter (DMT)-like permease
VKATALILALSASAAWGIGGLLVKRGLANVSPEAILVFQYALGFVGVAAFVAVRGDWTETASSIAANWLAVLVIVIFQIGGYIFWIAAVHSAGKAISTAAIIAIAASYPALVAVLSGPILGEHVGWNDAVAVVLIVAGVIISQV